MANRIEVPAGTRFTRLVVVSEGPHQAFPGGSSHRRMFCLCDCGKTALITLGSLRNGHAKSCGCILHSRGIDIVTGMRFGRLVVIEPAAGENRGDGTTRKRWKCVCDCGAVVSPRSCALKDGTTSSCGCYQKDVVSKVMFKHGKSRNDEFSKEYSAWVNMRGRCNNPDHPAYQWYGGRGISVCQDWMDSFDNFLRDMGKAPAKIRLWSIERVDNMGSYRPGNVVWATQTAQMNNTRSNRLICHAGVTMTATQWSRRLGVSPDTLLGRLHAGWTHEDAIAIPIGKHVKTGEA